MPAYQVNYARNNEGCLRQTIVYLDGEALENPLEEIRAKLQKSQQPNTEIDIELFFELQEVRTKEEYTTESQESNDGVWDLEFLS